MYADDPLLHPLWDSAVKTQELANDIGGNNGRNGADLGKLAASLMLPADGARVMMLETGGSDRPSGQRGRAHAQLRRLDPKRDGEGERMPGRRVLGGRPNNKK